MDLILANSLILETKCLVSLKAAPAQESAATRLLVHAPTMPQLIETVSINCAMPVCILTGPVISSVASLLGKTMVSVTLMVQQAL